MTDKEADLENEHAWLAEMVKTEGWKLYEAKWRGILDECSRKLRESDCDDRDWLAGLVTGYTRLLDYPNNRLISIQKVWKTKNAA